MELRLRFSMLLLCLGLQQTLADDILTPEQAKKLNPETGLYKIHNDEVITNKYKIEVKGLNGITIGCYGYQQLDGSWLATNYVSNDFEGYRTITKLDEPISVEPESGKSFTLVFSEILPKCGSFWNEHIKVHPHTLDFQSSGSNQVSKIQTPSTVRPSARQPISPAREPVNKTPSPTVSTLTTAPTRKNSPARSTLAPALPKKSPPTKLPTNLSPARAQNDLRGPSRGQNDLLGPSRGKNDLLGPARFLSVLSPQTDSKLTSGTSDKGPGGLNSLSDREQTTKAPFTPYKARTKGVLLAKVPASHPSASAKFPPSLIHSTIAEKPTPAPSHQQTKTTTTTTRQPYSPTPSASHPTPRYQQPTGYPPKYVPSGSKLTENACTPETPDSVIFGALSDLDKDSDEPFPISFEHCTCTCPNIRKIPKIVLQGKG